MSQRHEETVVLLPFMAQGHLIRFLALALQIEKKTGYKVIYVNTPLNIRKLKSSIPSTSSIQLVELPFCSSDHNLPPNSENTDVLPHHLMVPLFQASLSLKPFFHDLISNITNQQHGNPPLCIIADIFFGWTIEIANEFNSFHVVFMSGAYGYGMYFSVCLSLPHLQKDSDELMLLDFPEASPVHRSQLTNNVRNATGYDPWSMYIPRELSLSLKSDGILFNTVEEFDHVGMEYFRRKTGRPVWAIGPVDYSLTHKAREAKRPAGIDSDQCTKWLDTHPPGSVLYVSFGSQNTISSSQLMELAIGLEASGKKFIWVIRPPIGFDINGEFISEWLPEGFEERITKHNRGLLIHKWASQLEILSHKSTCAFLSHCGWNSVLETLSNGIPIIGWPLASEQFYNSKLLEEEVGVCVEIARGIVCEIEHKDVVRVIDMVMNETEKGKEMRKKACEVKEMLKNAIRVDDDEGFKGSSVKSMEEFLCTALSVSKTKRDRSNRIQSPPTSSY